MSREAIAATGAAVTKAQRLHAYGAGVLRAML
jgi:hypothetical protein